MLKKIYIFLMRLLSLVFFPLTFILVLLYKIRILKYKTASIFMSFCPGVIGDLNRRYFYEFTLKNVGTDLKIYYGSYIVYDDVEIGNKVTIEENCVISKCKIGNDVIIAADVSLMSGKNHHYTNDITKTFYESGGEVKKIVLEDNLWIGTRAVIMEDVSSGTVVGAGAVVTKKYDKNKIIAGIPAKIIKDRG